MQFNHNSDFPASGARPPDPFDPADSTPCACITTRILSRSLDAASRLPSDAQHVVVGGRACTVCTAKGVLVRTPTPDVLQAGGAGGWSDSSDDSSSFSSMDDGSDAGAAAAAVVVPARPAQNPQSQNGVVPVVPQAPAQAVAMSAGGSGGLVERAYWLRRTLRAAIYGQVRYGVVLHKIVPPVQVLLPASSEWVSVEWQETDDAVAIKEMAWEHIRVQRERLAEDPIKEVAAMQFLGQWIRKGAEEREAMEMMQRLAAAGNVDMSARLAGMDLSSSQQLNAGGGMGAFMNGNHQWGNPQHHQQQQMQQITQIQQPLQAMPLQNMNLCDHILQNMMESHIMMPMDLLSDDRNLYSIMPYCTGGELFDVLEKKNRFSEPEARYWMRQILKGLSCLKRAGVTHRDLSLENLLVHEGNVLIIDMGMCLRIPIADSRTNQRYLILPQGVCGKWHYMSPEVCKNQLPFDGPAVDLWATGVILFLMLTGFPPWERPVLADERFKYMSNGYLVQMLTEWKVGLSADAMDLLQRMFWLDPTDRLSLDQVCAHPWMTQQ
ncbi:hypothetical protein ACHAWF_009742 [Thalassiosira exigua]